MTKLTPTILKKLIKESTSEDFSFKTKMADKSIDYAESKQFFQQLIKDKIEEIDWIICRDLIVTWSIDFELKDQGINGIGLNIDNVLGSLEVEYIPSENNPDGNSDVFDYVFDAKKLKFKFEVLGGFRKGTLYPSNVLINFKTKTVQIEF